MGIAKQLVSHYRGRGELVDVYGVVLFTDAHPHVGKVLQDTAYWRASDEVSGDRWAIFSAKPKPGRTRMPRVRAGITGLMIPVWEEPSENKQLIKEFELESTQDLPTLLVFAWDQNSGEIVKVTIALDDSTVERAYNSLRENIRRVTEVFEKTDVERGHERDRGL